MNTFIENQNWRYATKKFDATKKVSASDLEILKEIQKERDEVLNTTSDIIHTLAPYVKSFIQDGCICVVGNEEKIMEKKEMFDHIEPLFH